VTTTAAAVAMSAPGDSPHLCSITASASAPHVTLFAFVVQHFRPPLGSRAHAARAIAASAFLVNGVAASSQDQPVRSGDSVSLNVTTHALGALSPEDCALPVLALDLCAGYVVLAKPPGMPLSGSRHRTLERSVIPSLLASACTTEDCASYSPVVIASVGRPMSGPSVVALTLPATQALSKAYASGAFRFVYRVVAHGDPSTHINSRLVDRADVSVILSIALVSTTKSTGACPLAELDVTTDRGDAGMRRVFYDCGHPVVGKAAQTRPSKGTNANGCFIACTRLSFPQPLPPGEHGSVDSSAFVYIDLPVPPKFSALLAREQYFWEKKAARIERDRVLCRAATTASEAAAAMKLPNSQIVRFCNLSVVVTDRVMTPRTSSELLVYAAFRALQSSVEYRRTLAAQACPRLLDLGTGSGCLLVASLVQASALGARGVGLDVSAEALLVAQVNLDLHGMSTAASLVARDFTDLAGLERHDVSRNGGGGARDTDREIEGFDVIMCNPPYLTEDEARRQVDPLNGPVHAMVAGSIDFVDGKGLECYDMVACGIAGNRAILREGGRVVVELGGKRSRTGVENVFERRTGFVLEETLTDENGFCRCLVFQHKS
jgi:methylase of polypeptide subunit release factors